jgi:pilus assembly protein FimV
MNATNPTMNGSCFRTFGLIAGWLALLLPFQAYALSLGGFHVESALDEPLRAEIQLSSVDAEVLESLEVKLGSAEDFRRADVPRSEYLQQLQFTVEEMGGGDAVVTVTSEQPMKEPFLHFLISVEWSGGKLVREYTGLLDPPLYADGMPADVAPPAVETTRAATGDEPDAGTGVEPAETGAAPSVATATAASAGRSAEYGPTREGDTLWNIASRLDTGAIQANVFQIMIALQRENPDAFIDNNINRLRTGAVLRLQDIAAVADVSPEQAGAMYTAQLEEWQSYTTRVASADDGSVAPEDPASPDTSVAEQPADAGAETPDSTDQVAAAAEGQDDVLRIVQATVDESEQSAAASAGSDRSGEVTALRSQMAMLEESLESRNLENEELRERVRLLESQLENAQRLIEIESQELALAQQQAERARLEAERAQEAAQEAQEAQEQALANQAEPEAQLAPAQSIQPVEEAGQEAVESSAIAEEREITEEPEAVEDAAATTATGAADDARARETSGTASQQASATGSTGSQRIQSTQSSQNVRTVANRSDQTSWWSQIPDMLFSSWMWMAGAGAGVLVLVLGLLMFLRRRQSIAEFEESILSGSALDSYSETTDTAATSASDTSFLSDFGTAGMGTMQADEVDPLAEAEVYLAYGRDEQAEDVLKEAARRDPDRAEVKLKLLEIYKQRNDVKAFETIAEELYPAGDSGDREVWSQVAAMGRELSPGNPLFQDPAPAGGAGGEASPGTPSAAQPSPSVAAEPAGGAMDLDLDLDDIDADEPARGTDAAAGPASNQQVADELDFNLDDIGGPSESPAPAAETISREDTDTTLDFGEEFLERPSGNVDPATQPFPAPDQQTDLDRELDRLASEREVAAGTTSSGTDTRPPSREASWEKADSDADTLDFPASDTSEIDFDLNLDESSIQRMTSSDKPEQAGTGQAESDAGSDSGEIGEGLLEFESENIPPEETWAGPSTDAAPTGTDDSAVSYSPGDDVQSSDAPQYNEAETKLDLARAYLDMGDKVGARSIIDEVMREGDPAQRDQAAELASQL